MPKLPKPKPRDLWGGFEALAWPNPNTTWPIVSVTLDRAVEGDGSVIIVWLAETELLAQGDLVTHGEFQLGYDEHGYARYREVGEDGQLDTVVDAPEALGLRGQDWAEYAPRQAHNIGTLWQLLCGGDTWAGLAETMRETADRARAEGHDPEVVLFAEAVMWQAMVWLRRAVIGQHERDPLGFPDPDQYGRWVPVPDHVWAYIEGLR